MQPKKVSFFRGPAFFILPALAIYIFIIIVPVVGTVILTFFRWRGMSFHTLNFVGWENYKTLLFHDPIFWQSFANTLIFTGGTVALECALGLAVALILEQNMPLTSFFRGTYLIPGVISVAIVGLVLTLLLSPALKVLPSLLKPIYLERLAFLGSWLFSEPQKALYGLIIVQVWYGFGWSMFIFISGLKAINPELYEAAEVDGASGWEKIIHITLPLLKGTTSVAVLIATMWTMAVFALPFVLTRGGPGHATELLSTWAFLQAFRYARTGYGSAIASILLVFGFLLGFLIFKFTRMGK